MQSVLSAIPIIGPLFSKPKTPDIPAPPPVPSKADAASAVESQRKQAAAAYSKSFLTSTYGDEQGDYSSALPYIGKKVLTGQ